MKVRQKCLFKVMFNVNGFILQISLQILYCKLIHGWYTKSKFEIDLWDFGFSFPVSCNLISIYLFSFTHSFNKYLWSTQHMLRDTAINKSKLLFLWNWFPLRESDNKQVCEGRKMKQHRKVVREEPPVLEEFLREHLIDEAIRTERSK